jgi:hypothetical protein
LDFSEDFLPFGFPNISLRVEIALREIGLYGRHQIAYAGEAAVANTIDGQVAEEAFAASECFTSPARTGACLISDFEPVSATIFCARSLIVIFCT